MTLYSPAPNTTKTDDSIWASIAREEERQELQLELVLLREPLVRQNGPLKKEERKPFYQNQQIALHQDP